MKTTKVLKTEDNTILIATASTEGTGEKNKYVSVTAHEIRPILLSEAKKQVLESLEDGENWKVAVASGYTEKGLSEWIDEIINNDGELSGFDNSLYNKQVEIDGEEYIYYSEGCGCLHDSINECTEEFKELIGLHLSKEIKYAEQLITKIEIDNIDENVLMFTKEIVNQ